MDIQIIKTRKDYGRAIARLSALMSLDPQPQSDAENELELLALVIEDFERRTVPAISAVAVEAILTAPTTMTSKGQVTVPRRIRDRLGLNSGDKISFTLLSDRTVIMRPKTRRLI